MIEERKIEEGFLLECKVFDIPVFLSDSSIIDVIKCDDDICNLCSVCTNTMCSKNKNENDQNKTSTNEWEKILEKYGNV